MSWYLKTILYLMNFLATSEVFATQRAAMLKRAEDSLDPRLFSMIEFLVAIANTAVVPETGEPLPGGEKKSKVLSLLANSKPEITGLLATSPQNLVNEAIEFAVAKLRASTTPP